MQRRSERSNSALPLPLLQSTPRHVRLNWAGIFALIVSAALIVGGLWGGSEIYRRAALSARRVALFASEGVSTGAQVVRMQQRRGEGNRRTSTVHYRYVVGDQEHGGTTTVRRGDRDRYVAGSQIVVRYLSSEPQTSWMEGYEPRRQPVWPAFVLMAASFLGPLGIVARIRRQSQLLGYGRPALAVITKVEKKRSDKGTYWRVHYEWTLLSGGKRKGHYRHNTKEPPSVGATVPIVYDRDQPSRHGKYPLSLVAVSESRK
jgi:Protein of unknown function (DUF3592)